jgi:phenylalanyl-tRNA synthetase beta chain
MFELLLDAVIARRVPVGQGVARLLPVERDIAVIVKDTVTHEALMKAVWSASQGVSPTQGAAATQNASSAQALLRDAVLFDVYRPKEQNASMALDEKSLAVRLTLNSDEATLTEAQIEAVVQSVVASLSERVGARLRA